MSMLHKHSVMIKQCWPKEQRPWKLKGFEGFGQRFQDFLRNQYHLQRLWVCNCHRCVTWMSSVEASGQNCLFCALVTLISTIWLLTILWQFFGGVKHSQRVTQLDKEEELMQALVEQLGDDQFDDGAIEDNRVVHSKVFHTVFQPIA